MINLKDILKNTSYADTLFSEAEKAALEAAVVMKEAKQGQAPYIQCLIRGKEIKLTPEEVNMQLFLHRLIYEYHYPVSRIHVEEPVYFGREVKRADIVIFDKDKPTVPYIIVEVKSPKWKDGKEQLRSYCNASGAPLAVWTNGKTISYYNRKDPNYFEAIPDIPNAAQKLSDIYAERWTYQDLIEKDKLAAKGITLKDVVLEMEDEVMANFGGDHFEEIFKLVFTKLFDEMESGRDAKRHLEFRNYGDSGTQFKAQMQALFDKAKEKWDGVFNKAALFALAPSHLAGCVSYLESIKLFNSNLEIVDEAFEYLVNQNMKGDKGQYFTPRYVI
ncbi:MAG: type I restriction enzyme HsdR N-terminal domain-containing protein, partial [Spirochaetaceae bacterium]|nr:type I restriction enzyme HsdR N-terminal domain-containing protein [Spirochaetaceae bacterium]